MFSGSLVALITPMLDSGELDFQALERLIDLHLKAGSDGLVILGSTGEGSALAWDERVAFVRYTLNKVDKRIPVIVGVGTSSTQMTIEQAQKMADLGVDGLLVICPYYNKPTQEGIYQHFALLNEQVNCPVILYNHPGRTGSDMEPEMVARLAVLPNIVGIKEAKVDAERFKALQALAGDSFELYSGNDDTCLDLFQHGASGVISVVANIIPEKMQVLSAAALKGDWEQAQNLLTEYLPLMQAMNIESNPIPVKWAVAKLNQQEKGIRLPLTLLTPAGQIKLEKCLANFGLVAKENVHVKIA
jgi:4-hydroxy-tetrahydrodipicolinate synthase